jgi:hypothetical protein
VAKASFAARIFPLNPPHPCATFPFARAHGLWTYEPRQGRKAATVVCSAFAVVTLALFKFGMRSAECRMS